MTFQARRKWKAIKKMRYKKGRITKYEPTKIHSLTEKNKQFNKISIVSRERAQIRVSWFDLSNWLPIGNSPYVKWRYAAMILHCCVRCVTLADVIKWLTISIEWYVEGKSGTFDFQHRYGLGMPINDEILFDDRKWNSRY